MSVYQLTAREIYDTYASGITPDQVMAQGRTTLATRLMVEEGLTEADAYYAADQMMEHAQRIIDRNQNKD